MAERVIKTDLQMSGEKAYKEACKDINNSLKVLGSEMKVVSAEFAGNEKSTEALTAKQEILKKQFDEQTKKVEENEKMLAALRAEENQNVDAIRRFEIALNNSKAEMIKTQNEINKLGKELEGSGASSEEFARQLNLSEEAAERLKNESEQAKKEIQDFSNNAKEMGEKIKTGFLAVGAVIGAAFAGIVKAGDDYKGAMNGFIAQTGLGKESSEEFNEAMMNIYKGNYGESFKDIGEAMATVAQSARDVDPKNIEKLTTNAIVLRDTFGYDIQESMRAVNMLMDQFGISSDEAFNLIVQGAQNGLDKNGDLLDSINEYSVHFKQLGLNADDFFASLYNGSYEGTFSVDKLGDAVKEFGIRVKDESKGTNEALAAIGLDAKETTAAFSKGGEDAKKAFQDVATKLFEMKDPLAQNQAGVALFGTAWEDLGVDGVKALTDLNSEIDKSNSALAQVDKIKYNDLGNAIAGIGRMFIAEFAIPISEKVLPLMNDFANKLKDGEGWVKPLAESVGGFVEFIATNGSQALSIIGGIAAAFATFKVVSVSIVIATAVFAAFKTMIDLVKGSQLALNAAQMANPIGIVVGLIAGLVVAITILWNTNEGFRDAVIGSWEAIKEACVNLWGTVVNFFTVTIPAAFNSVIDFMTNNWQGLLLLIVNPFAGAFKLLYDNCEGFKIFVNGFIETVKQFFITGWEAIVTFFTEGIPSFIQSVITWFEELPTYLGTAIGLMVGNFIKFGIDIYTWATTEIPKFVGTVVKFISEMPTKIWQWLTKIVSDILLWTTNLVSTAQTEIPKFISTIVNLIAGMPNQIWQWLTKVVNDVVAWVANLVTKAQTEMPKFVSALVEAVSSLPTKFYDIGVNIIQGMWNGINSMISWVTNRVMSFVKSMVSAVQGVLGIQSPSKVFAEIGGFMAQGLEVGFGKEMKTVEQDIRKAIPTDFDIKGKVNYQSKNKLTRGEESGKASVQVIQNIYTPQYDYVAQQREAAKQFKLIARQV